MLKYCSSLFTEFNCFPALPRSIYFYRSTPPAIALVRKLIAVLESIEKLPVYTYDAPSAGYGLQVSGMTVWFGENNSYFLGVPAKCVYHHKTLFCGCSKMRRTNKAILKCILFQKDFSLDKQ